MKGNQVAWWAGIAAFFGTVLAIGAIDILNPDDRVQFLGGVLVGLITGGTVYSRQRLDDAKQGRINGGIIRITEVGDKKMFTLELADEPVMFEDKKEVIFTVSVNRGEE